MPHADVLPMRTLHTFRTWLREECYSPRTCQQYLGYAARATRDLGPLHRVTPADLRTWWATLPPTASSRNGARNALAAYYRHRGTVNLALTLPRIPEPDSLPRPVPVATYEHLLDAARALGGRHETLYLLLAYTGCRIGEARTARRSQFDLGDRPTWRIEGKGSGRRGPKRRVIAVHPVLAAHLRASTEVDWLFPSPFRDAPVHRTTLGQLMRDLAGHAGVDATAHRIRHACATIGLERSRDIRAVQELLGHASLSTTQRYTEVTGDRVRGLVDHLGPAA